MRHVGRWAALVLLVLSAASGEARPFYALSGGRILGCGPNDTLTINAECTNSPTDLVVGPAVPIERGDPPGVEIEVAGPAGETCRGGTSCGTIGRVQRPSARHQRVVQEIPRS